MRVPQCLSFILIVAAYAILWTNMASAGNDQTPGIDWREHNQNHRIYNGIQNGSLSFNETGQLLRGQAQMHRMERRAKRDGIVTRRERDQNSSPAKSPEPPYPSQKT